MFLRKFFVSVFTAALAGAAACGGASDPAPPATTGAAGHAHEAPHGGTLVELGEHFGFLEFVLDGDAGSLTMYVLDGEAEQSVRIAQPAVSLVFEAPSGLAGQTLPLVGQANVLTGETVGDTSQFSLIHEALKGQSSFAARLADVSVKGQAFRDLAVKRP